MKESSSTIMESSCNLKKEVPNIILGHSVSDDSVLEVGCTFPTRDVLLLALINANPDSGSSAVPPCDKTQPAFPRPLREKSDNLQKGPRESRKKCPM